MLGSPGISLENETKRRKDKTKGRQDKRQEKESKRLVGWGRHN